MRTRITVDLPGPIVRDSIFAVGTKLSFSVELPDAPREGVVRAGDMELDHGARAVRVNGSFSRLTGREYEVAALLFDRPGRLVTKEQLWMAVWGFVPKQRAGDARAPSRAVDSQVSRLRTRHGVPIANVWGQGYALAVRDDVVEDA